MTTDLASRPTGSAVDGIRIDQSAILKHLGLDANDPAAQALVLACQRYDLDPILKHALLIEGRLYVTRDGLLHVAHRSGQLDGIEVLEQDETDTHHVAKVAVYRKDMARPFAYVGRFPKMRPQFEWKSNSAGKRYKTKVGEELHPYGPEMAVKCAEAMALRRAFDVSLSAADEMWDQAEVIEAKDSASVGQTAVTGSAGSAGEPVRSDDRDPEDSSRRSSGPDSSEDVPLYGERPCPHCGHEVNELKSSNARAPKWKCSNDDCTGHHNTKTDKDEPWVSWSTNPWKPGGEFESIVKSEAGSTDADQGSASSTEPTAATGREPEAVAPSGEAVEGGGGESSLGDEQPSPQDGERALTLIEDALDASIVRVSDVLRAASPLVVAITDAKVPTKRADFASLPVEVLVAVADKLKLQERIPA